MTPFTNEPFYDFTDHTHIRDMQAALAEVAADLGHEYDLVIAGRRIRTADKLSSVNPARPAQVVGIHQLAEAEHAPAAVAAASEAFITWSRTPLQTRVDLLLEVSRLIKLRKMTFCAWLTYEVGKNWSEADADVSECIDFMEFYAREALRLDTATTPIQFPGERNQFRYLPPRPGRRHPALELPFRHHGRHDRRRHRHRQHRRPKTFHRRPHHRRQILLSP